MANERLGIFRTTNGMSDGVDHHTSAALAMRVGPAYKGPLLSI